MLKIFDENHNPTGYIQKYTDLKIESDVTTGDRMLSFSYLGRKKINTEYYIQDEKDEYVIKEKTASTGGDTEYVAALNLEELEAKPWDTFSVKDSTIEEAARLALAGTGWTVGECTVTKKRNAGMMRVSSLGVIEKLCTAFMCERVYDTKNKTVSFYETAGEDKGVYFTRSLNLKKLTRKDSSYDYYTRIIPVGENGITIEDVNDGKNYLENFQYSSKIRTYIWVDESYTSKQALKDDAEKKLADMSKPLVSYSADVIDLAKQKPEYNLLSFNVGDTIHLFDEATQIQDTQRIVKMTEYPQDPSKNTCELANMALTFEELRQKEQEAAEIINAVISPDGKIKVSDILHFDDGVAGSKTFADLAEKVNDISLTVGEITTNYLKVEDAKILYATIESLNVTNADVENLTAEYGKFKSLVADEFAADRALISNLDTNKANINFANVAVASIEQGFLKSLMVSQGLLADKVISPEVTVTDVLTGVHVYANDITAGTLSVERLEIRGSENSIVYALNNITGALQAESTDTLNGEILTERTITADKIVAESITAKEIASRTITAIQIASGTITGNEIKAKAITAAKIDVMDLFAQDITATGTIRGVNLVGVTASFTGEVVLAENTSDQYKVVASALGKILITDGRDNTGYSYAGIQVKRPNTGEETFLNSQTLTISYEKDTLKYTTRYCSDGIEFVNPMDNTKFSAVLTVAADGNSYYVGHYGTFSKGLTASGKIKLTASESSPVSLISAYKQTSETTATFTGLTIASPSDQEEAYPAIQFKDQSGGGDVSRYLIYNGIEDRFSMVNGLTVKDLAFVDDNYWYTIDKTWIRAKNNKHIYTGGLIQAGTEFSSCKTRDWRFGCGTGTGDENQFGFYDTQYGLHCTIVGSDHSFRLNGEYWCNRGGASWAFGSITGTGDAHLFSFYDVNTNLVPLSIAGATGNIYVGQNTSGANVGILIGQMAAGKRAYLYSSADYPGALWIQTRYNGNWVWYSLGQACSKALSDIRLKTDIKEPEVANAMDVINTMQLHSFTRKDSREKYRIGFIADELEQIDPTLTDGGGEVDGHPYYKSVNELQVTAYVVKAIQELSERVISLEKENAELRKSTAV